jgi:hypothetical protein
MRLRTLTMSVVLASCLGAAASGQRQAPPVVTAHPLVGVWDLVSYEDRRPNGEVLHGWDHIHLAC